MKNVAFFDKLKGAFRSESNPKLRQQATMRLCRIAILMKSKASTFQKMMGATLFGNLGDEDEAIAKLKSSSRVWRRAKADRLLIALKSLPRILLVSWQ